MASAAQGQPPATNTPCRRRRRHRAGRSTLAQRSRKKRQLCPGEACGPLPGQYVPRGMDAAGMHGAPSPTRQVCTRTPPRPPPSLLSCHPSQTLRPSRGGYKNLTPYHAHPQPPHHTTPHTSPIPTHTPGMGSNPRDWSVAPAPVLDRVHGGGPATDPPRSDRRDSPPVKAQAERKRTACQSTDNLPLPPPRPSTVHRLRPPPASDAPRQMTIATTASLVAPPTSPPPSPLSPPTRDAATNQIIRCV